MDAGQAGSYRALNQVSGVPPRWWERVARPITTCALRAWSALPHFARAPFIPVGRWINPHQSTAAATAGPGPDTVPGVAPLRSQGFEPIEDHTGFVEIAELWPQEHRRFVAETRSWRLDHAECDGRLWLVRSPWPALGLRDALNVVWSWVEHGDVVRSSADAARGQVLRARAAEALRWDQATATRWASEQADS